MLDLFGGIRYTLIACEKTGRQARLIEIGSEVLRCSDPSLAIVWRRASDACDLGPFV